MIYWAHPAGDPERLLAEVEALRARAEAAERERDEARAEIIAATTWYADNFGVGEDDPDPADMTLGQMLLAIYDWGNFAWGNAGRESERADEAHSRLYAAVTRSEAAEALAERRGDALRQIKPLVTGDLPPLTPLPMTMRCVRIADIVDAALARFAALRQTENAEEEAT